MLAASPVDQAELEWNETRRVDEGVGGEGEAALDRDVKEAPEREAGGLLVLRGSGSTEVQRLLEHLIRAKRAHAVESGDVGEV